MKIVYIEYTKALCTCMLACFGVTEKQGSAARPEHLEPQQASYVSHTWAYLASSYVELDCHTFKV